MKKQYDFTRGKRGAVLPTPAGKTRITIRIDDEVLEWFRKQAHAAGGGNYQTMVNQALRDYVAGQVEPFEETLRRVLSEVLPASQSRRARRSVRPASKRGAQIR
jgi:hypothetical protein